MKVLLWDWNGTLINDAPVAWAAFNDTLAAYGRSPVTFASYQEVYRHPAILMYQLAGVDTDKHDFEEISDHYHQFYVARSVDASLHHDTVTTLEAMAAQGRRQAILSALAHELLPIAVASHGIDHFFESIAGSQDKRGDGKIESGRALVGSLGVRGGEVTVIGDSSHDAEVARALGAQCVLVARGLESAARLQRNGVPVIDSFEDLVGHLSGFS
jgi:phosphoglycolate phosphatase